MYVRKIFSFVFLFILFLSKANCQNIVWEKTVSYSSNPSAFNSMDITNDKKIVAGGNINSGDTAYLCKFDTSGIVIWTKLGYVGKSNSGDKYIKQLKSGNLIYTTDALNGIGAIQKLNASGDTLPHWEYGDTGSTTSFFQTIELPGGQLISAAIHNGNFALLKIDTSGNFISLKEYPYGSIGNDQSWDLILNSKGNFVLTGHSFSYITGYGASHRKLMEINPDGDTIRTKLIVIKDKNINEDDYFFSQLIETSRKKYLLCSSVDSLDASNQIVGSIGAVTLLDTNFNIIWSTFLPGFGLPPKAKELSDSSFVVLATDGLNNKIYFYKLDKNGNIIYSKYLPSSICSTDLGFCDFKILGDSSIIAVGACTLHPYIIKINNIDGSEYIPHDTCQSFTPSFTAQQTADTLQFLNTSNGGYAYASASVWKFADSTSSTTFNAKIHVNGVQDSIWAKLIATNPYGCMDTIEKKIKVSQVTAIKNPTNSYQSLSVNVFPNPFSQSTVFNINGSSNSSYQLKILNSLGEEISSYNFSGNEFTLNASSISSGLYMYVLRDGEGKTKSGKLAVE
jgi:hypothetical protein